MKPNNWTFKGVRKTVSIRKKDEKGLAETELIECKCGAVVYVSELADHKETCPDEIKC